MINSFAAMFCIGFACFFLSLAQVFVRAELFSYNTRNLDDVEIGEAVSTRLLIYAAKLVVQGFKPYEACIHSIIYSLSDDEELIEVLKKLVKLYFVN